MEIVNKIQIRLDTLQTSAATLNILFALDFFPVDNTELQESEFVEKEKVKAVNPIVDTEKYEFYPTFFSSLSNQIVDAFTINYVIDGQYLNFLGLTDDDIFFEREPFRRTYLRLNFYDSPDTKIQNLFAREIIHLRRNNSWIGTNNLIDQTTVPLTFTANFKEVIYNSVFGEGFHFYWYKENLPKTLYMRPSIMNGKTGKIINLYSSINPLSTLPGSLSESVQVTSAGLNYIKTDFYERPNKRQKFYYIFNSDNKSDIVNLDDSPDFINNSITINLKIY